MQVYLVRHSDASSIEEDPQRGLSEWGRSKAEKVARHLAGLSLDKFRIYHSDKLRACQTAEIIAAAFAGKMSIRQRNNLGPNASISDWVHEINANDENVMLVGHLPFMARLGAALLTGNINNLGIVFETATVMRLCGEGKGHWFLEWMLSPRIIP